VQVSTMNLPGLGPVLVNGQGRTLYMFVPDGRRTVTCVSSCAAIWPPVKLSNGQRAVAAGQAKPSLLGSDPDPAGGQVAAAGQGLNLNGGLWYVFDPSGKVIHKTP
jgi:hypothetical protein